MERTVVTARSADDLLASLPVIFGFTPAESLCLLGLSGERSHLRMGARLDLEPPGGLSNAVRDILGALGRQGCEAVVLVAVSRHADDAEEAIATSLEACGEHWCVPTAVWADENTVWSLEDPCVGSARSSSTHPMLATAVLAGREVVATRDDLVHRVRPHPGARPLACRAPATDPRQIERLVARCLDLLDTCSPLDDSQLLWLADAVNEPRVRDACLSWIETQTAEQLDRHGTLSLWQRAAREVYGPGSAAALCLAAFTAHRLGDGAQLLIAAERAAAEHPDSQLPALLMQLAASGLGPQDWDQWRSSGTTHQLSVVRDVHDAP